MNILLLGSGGREHALAWKIADSVLLTKAPGNAGIPATMQRGRPLMGSTTRPRSRACRFSRPERRRRAVASSPMAGVLNFCASGKTVAEAQARAYEAVDRIKWPDGFCRRDIGFRAVERESGV